MKRRKLITSACYSMIDAKLKLGVPLAKVMRDMGLTALVSRPSLAKLIKHYNHMVDYDDSEIQASLFPAWIDSTGSAVQEQPDGWVYKGYFPLGEWLNEND